MYLKHRLPMSTGSNSHLLAVILLEMMSLNTFMIVLCSGIDCSSITCICVQLLYLLSRAGRMYDDVDLSLSETLGLDPSLLDAEPPQPNQSTSPQSDPSTPKAAEQTNTNVKQPQQASSKPSTSKKAGYRNADITNSEDNRIRQELDDADATLEQVGCKLDFRDCSIL